MKKFVSALIIVMLCAAAAPAFAMDFIVGVKGGYFLWDSYMKESNVQSFEDMERGDGILYGPIFSLLFTPDISLSVTGFVGRQSAQWLKEDGEVGSGADHGSGNYTFSLFRADVDSALSYRFLDYFRVFAGYKYLYLGIDIRSVEMGQGPADALEWVSLTNSEVTTAYHGPALGVGFSLPFLEKYFVAANVSAAYLMGNFEMDFGGFGYMASDLAKRVPNTQPNVTSDLQMWNLNFEPSIGVSPGPGLPIVTLGFRLQWSRVKFEEDLGDLNNDWLNDWVYGVFVAIMYAI